MKNYDIKLIDRRYTGSHFARYRIHINDGELRDFPAKIDLYRRMKNWCTDTWGHSCEARYHGYLEHHGYTVNPHWAWDNPSKYNLFYFFLATDKELNFFQLRWPNER